MNGSIIDLAFFEQNSFGDPNLYRELLEIFVKTTPEMLYQIKAAAAENNHEQLAKVAHKLKSNTQTVGLNDIYASLDKLENIGQAPLNKTNIESLVENIYTQCTFAVAEVQKELNNL